MHNTGNPLGSTQLLDLYDNSEVVDQFTNSQQDEIPDRFGVKRLTLAGLIKRSMALRNEINDFSGAMTFKPEWTDVPMNVSEGVGGEGGALNLQAEALGNRSEINKITSREALRRSYAEAGYNLIGRFSNTGLVVNSATDVVLWESTGIAYAYSGGLPHTIAAAETPVGNPLWASKSANLLREEVTPRRFKISSGSFGSGGSAVCGKSSLFYAATGMYYSPRNGTLSVGPGSVPDSNWISVGLSTMLPNSHNLFDFGCIDDNGVTDNRAKIQLAIEYMEFFKSTLMTDSSKDTTYFGVTTFDPNNALCCLTLRSPRTLDISGGRSRNFSIKYTGMLPGTALFSLKTPAHDFGGVITDLGASASNLLDYVLAGNDQWYANMRITGGCYQEAVLDNIHLSCYMTTLDRVFSNSCGRNGFAFGGPDSGGGWAAGTSTSINIDNCWARAPKNAGFSVANELWYSQWRSTGVDGIAGARVTWAYAIEQAKGVTLSSIGAENCERLLKVGTFRGLTLQGMQVASFGPEVGTAAACIELVGGTDAIISGFAPRDVIDSKFTNTLLISGPHTGNEYVQMLDESITSNRIGIVKRGGFYKYPDVVYYAGSDTRDSGFKRTEQSLHVGKDFGVFAGQTKKPDTILSRKFWLVSESIQTTIFISVPTANATDDFNAEIDVTCHEEGIPPVAVKCYVVRRSGVSTLTVISGVFPAAWRLDTHQTAVRVITTTVAKKTFVITTELVSPTATVTFKL